MKLDTPVTTAAVTYDPGLINRWRVTAYNAGGESQPGNTVTNLPPIVPPTGPIISLSAPTFSSTNVAQGQSVVITATLRNSGDGAYSLTDGSITLLAPSATRQDGPYVWATRIPAQIISAGQVLTLNPTWTAPTNAEVGQWTAYLVIKDAAGTWTVGPMATFNVVGNVPPPLPPLPPTNLKITKIGSTRIDLSWNNSPANSTRLERSKSGGPYTVLAMTAPGTLHYTTSFTRKTEYWFRAQSVSPGGVSAYCDPVPFYSR
jgi:hypothetical protein